MFVNNFYKWLPAFLFYGNTSCGTTFVDYNKNTRELYGRRSSTYPDISTYMNNVLNAISTNVKGVAFGTGTTPVAVDDYTLSGDLVSEFSVTSIETLTGDDDGMSLSFTYTITNTGTEDITIGEVGMFVDQYYASGGSIYTTSMLIERTVLDFPLTIEPGTFGQVTYTICFNYPTV